MKKKLPWVMILILLVSVFLSCERRSKQLLSFVERVHIDGCQYDKEGNVLYFCHDTVAICYSSMGDVIIGTDTLSSKKDNEMIQKIAVLLKEKWPVPEIYSAVCIRRFNQMLEKEHIDSSFMRKIQNTEYYTFFLSDEIVVSIIINGFLPLKPNEDIYIYTDKKGKSISEFSDVQFEWPIKEKEKILDTLIAKSKQKHPVFVEKQCRPIRSLFTREELLSRLK